MGVKVYHNNQWQEFSSGSATAASIIIQDEGVQLPGVAAALNFTGDGVTASGSGTTKEINVNGKFTGLSDTPANYTGAANKLVAVNTGANGNGTALEFIDATAPGVGVDNYVNGVSFSGGTLTLERTGTLADLTTTIDLEQIANRTFLNLSDTPSDYVGHAHKFVRVNKDGATSNGTALEFVTQIPGTAVGAVGNDKQIQFNDGGSILAGADGLEFHKDTNNPDLILKPASTQQTGIYGGNIIVESTEDTGNNPWNSAAITADGGLELSRRRISSPRGGPYVDFKAQNGVDFDARIQMDYDNGNVDDGAIDPAGDDFSAITFATGGYSYYAHDTNQNGRTVERIRIGKKGEIGIEAGYQMDSTTDPNNHNNIPPGQAGSDNPIVVNTRTDAQKYGNAGQVLTSAGKGNSVYWGNSTTSSTFSNPILVDITNPSPAPAATQGSTVNLAEFRSSAPNSVELLIYNARVKYPAGSGSAGTGWEGVATRIGRQIDVTNQAHIQFGANDGSGEQNIHLHTNQLGDIQLQDAKRILLHANKVDFAKLGTLSGGGGYVGNDYAGMTIVANSGNVSGTTTIDTGISVNQGHGGGVGLLLSSDHHDWGTSAVDARVDMIKFAVGSGPSNRNSVPTRTNLGGSAVYIYIGKSTQNTLTITMNLPSGHGGRWALMMMGGNCVDAFTVDV